MVYIIQFVCVLLACVFCFVHFLKFICITVMSDSRVCVCAHLCVCVCVFFVLFVFLFLKVDGDGEGGL